MQLILSSTRCALSIISKTRYMQEKNRNVITICVALGGANSASNNDQHTMRNKLSVCAWYQLGTTKCAGVLKNIRFTAES